MSVVATVEQQTTEAEQQTAVPEQQTTSPQHIPSKKAQLPKYNCRVAAYFEDRQLQNIKILQQKSGGTETGVLRTAVDLLSFVNNLPTSSDPSIYLNNFLVLTNNQGDSHDR